MKSSSLVEYFLLGKDTWNTLGEETSNQQDWSQDQLYRGD